MIDPFFGLRPWVVAMVFLGFILIASEAGFRKGLTSHVRIDEDTKTWMTTIAASVLGVLGLLLAFTMTMAVTRFDNRRTLALEEANAIGTSFWRSQLAPSPEGPEIRNLLREYTDARIQFSAAVRDKDVSAAHERSVKLHPELWSRAKVFAERNPQSVIPALLLQALNATFDLEESRWIASRIHVPEGVIWADVVVALMSGLLVGYSLGLTGQRNSLYMLMLALCFTLVLGVIIDLDEPRRGLIRISHRSLIDVRQQMGPPTH